MVGVEDGFAERLGNNDERDRVRGWEQSLVHTEVRVVERDGMGSEVRVVGRVHRSDQVFRPGSSRVVAEVSQELGEVRVSVIRREPGSSIGRCSGEQAVDGRGGVIGTGGEVTVGKELGGKGSTGAIGKTSRESGRGSGKKRWVEFGGKTGEGKRV
jgi:hypothetical protein